MEPTQGHFEVAVCDDTLYVRAVGLASMYNSSSLEAFANQQLAAGCRHVIFDLGECSGMDSTFMGVMAGLVKGEGDLPPPRVTVVNAGPRNLRLLEGVGLTEVVKVIRDWMASPGLETEILHNDLSGEERLELVRRAHQKLIELNPKNREAFAPYLRLIEEELKKRSC